MIIFLLSLVSYLNVAGVINSNVATRGRLRLALSIQADITALHPDVSP